MTSVDEFPNTNPCQKLDPWCVDAYFDLQLTPSDSTILTLDNSWGPTSVDLEPAIKAGETITHLLLTDSALQYNREDYGRNGAENGGVDCINGDNLSKIISMKYLKDVGGNAPVNGDVYMFNTAADKFQPYNLQTFINQTNSAITTLNNQVGELQAGLTAANARIDAAISDYNTKITNLDTKLTNQINQVQQQLQAQITANTNAISALQTTVNNLQSDYNAFKTTTNNRLSAIEATIAKPSWAPANATIAWGNINYESNYDPTGHLIGTHDPSSPVQGDGQFK